MDIPGHDQGKINAATSCEGLSLTIRAVENLAGIHRQLGFQLSVGCASPGLTDIAPRSTDRGRSRYMSTIYQYRIGSMTPARSARD